MDQDIIDVALDSFKCLEDPIHAFLELFRARAYHVGQYIEAITTPRCNEGCKWSRAFIQLYLSKSRVGAQFCKVPGTCKLSQGDVHRWEWLIFPLNVLIELCQVHTHSDFTVWLGGYYHWGTLICWVVHW